MVESYMFIWLHWTHIVSKQLLFTGITNTRAGENLYLAGDLSYTMLYELFKRNWRSWATLAKKLAYTDCLCLGRVSAVANAGISNRLFKNMDGRSQRIPRITT